MKYKLIALDVDGTLINDHHELTETTKETVQAVAKRGAEIVLCTGRNPSSTLPILAMLGLEGTVITHNGAATIESAGRRQLHHFPFTVEEAMPLIRYCRENEIHFDLNTPFDMYLERISDTEKAMYEQYLAEPILLSSVTDLREPLVKMTAFGTKETMDRVEQDWRELDLPLNRIRSGDYFIDVMNPLASKGSALKLLAGSRGIDRSEVLAIGNYYNDLAMLEFAGLGIAMANSPEPVKQAADDTTATNNEDGVHQALLKYCLS